MEAEVVFKLSEINDILSQLSELPLKHVVQPWAALKQLTEQKLKEQQAKQEERIQQEQ